MSGPEQTSYGILIFNNILIYLRGRFVYSYQFVFRSQINMNIEEFKKVELKVGTIISAERVEGSEKLLKLGVDLGEKDESDKSDVSDESDKSDVSDESDKSDAPSRSKYRQVLAGIAKDYAPEQLIGRQAMFVANLEPRKLMGLESQGMILATDDAEGRVVLFRPDGPVPPGSQAH